MRSAELKAMLEDGSLDVDTPVHVVCKCGSPEMCVAPGPKGYDGHVYDPSGDGDKFKTLWVDLGPHHPNCHVDCGHVFLFKVSEVSIRE